jgi:two-component system response regulator
MNDKAILLVEDNPDDEELIVAALQKNGVGDKIFVARDGVEAIDYLFGTGPWVGRGHNVRPQLILLDLKLPKMGGFDVLRRLRAEPGFAATPVVVLTSSSEEEEVFKSYKLGANSYVRKPVEFERFRDAIGQMALYWLKLNEAPL